MDVLRTDAKPPSSAAVDEGRKRIGKHARIDFADPEMSDLSRDQHVTACCVAERDSAAGVSTQGVDQDVALVEVKNEPRSSDRADIQDGSLCSAEKADSVPKRKERNESFDCIRLIAFIGVIFLHLNVTIDMATNETMGSINAVVRFAVPYFFAITGFFLCNAEPYAMGRGFRKEVVFVACSVAAYLIASYYGFWQWQGVGTSAPASLFFESDWVPDFLKWNSFGFAYHLWFLFALLYGYVILILWKSCRLPNIIFVLLGMAMMAYRMYLFEFGGVVDSLADPASSFVFLGFPSLAFGMLLSLVSKWLSKIPAPISLVVVVLGAWASIQEALEYGLQEIYVGSLIVVLGLFALCLRCPHPFSRIPVLRQVKILAKFGGMPAGIAYVVHLAIVQHLLADHLLDPLAVDFNELLFVWGTCAALSIAIGFIVSFIIWLPKWIWRKISERGAHDRS